MGTRRVTGPKVGSVPPSISAFIRAILPAAAIAALGCMNWALATPAPAPLPVQSVPPDPDERSWSERVALASRTSFPRRAGFLALRVAEERDAVSSGRLEAALLAIGASGLVSEQPRLETIAVGGLNAERKAAILALGELAASGVDPVWSSERLLERARQPLCLVVRRDDHRERRGADSALRGRRARAGARWLRERQMHCLARKTQRNPAEETLLAAYVLEIPVWWRYTVLPSLPWVVCFLSFFLFSIRPDRFE